MALITVYDLENIAHEKEFTDAKECVAVMGWSFDKRLREQDKTENTTIEEPAAAPVMFSSQLIKKPSKK